MEFADRYIVPATPDLVWEAMFDPDVMREVLPGCRRLERSGPHAFDVTLAAGIGVLRGVFSGSVAFRDLQPPERCAMLITAGGSLGRVTGDGTIELAPEDDATALAYRAGFTFAGPMSGLGETLMRSVADALTRDAMRRFSVIVSTRRAEG